MHLFGQRSLDELLKLLHKLENLPIQDLLFNRGLLDFLPKLAFFIVLVSGEQFVPGPADRESIYACGSAQG